MAEKEQQDKKEADTAKETIDKLHAIVLNEIKRGSGKHEIAQKLVDMGSKKDSAEQLVNSLHSEIMLKAEREMYTNDALVPAILGGLIAALIGGVLWGLIVILTKYEIGYMAIGIGVLSGLGVTLLTKGKKGRPLQIIAVASSFIGILVGKYITFFHFLKLGIEKELGIEVASKISLFSDKMVAFFFENIGSLVSGFDALWLILAFLTAWSIPQGLGITLPSHHRGVKK